MASESEARLNVLVLAGGPDREREVSLASGRQVADALRAAGHHVIERDIGPEQLEPLNEIARLEPSVVFPALHGRWGEGGGLQAILEQRGLAFVGAGASAARLCMNKHLTKQVLASRGLPTPESRLVRGGARLAETSLADSGPVVVKPAEEGSSIALEICRDAAEMRAAVERVGERYDEVLLERYIAGRELTVGLLESESGALEALPVLEIVPGRPFYDYHAKYEAADTRYLFEIDLPAHVLCEAARLGVEAGRACGVRHLGRVDFIVDATGGLWILELNTMPGFTSHSLLPMAADRAGLGLDRLVDRLVRRAAGG